jgi:hypothetical protein
MLPVDRDLLDVAVDESFDVLRDHVDFEMYGVARFFLRERRQFVGLGDDGDVELAVAQRRDGEADAVDGDRSLLVRT